MFAVRYYQVPYWLALMLVRYLAPLCPAVHCQESLTGPRIHCVKLNTINMQVSRQAKSFGSRWS
ncbi:MAG: hypothetical protein H6Q76_1669 [Firmicutes bacterium]|nr:hypothetical protein [Bacillota bacterium]